MTTKIFNELSEYIESLGINSDNASLICDYLDTNYSIRKGKNKNKSYEFIDNIINIFAINYNESRQFEYEMPSIGRERKAVGSLIKSYRAKNKDATSDKLIEDFKTTFTLCLNIKDNYIYQNMSLTYISLNLNKLKIILNANKSNKRIDKCLEVAKAVNDYFTDFDQQ